MVFLSSDPSEALLCTQVTVTTSIANVHGLKNLDLLPLLVSSVLGQAAGKIRYMPFGDSITEILQKAGYTNVDFVGSRTGQNPAGCSTATYDKDNEGHSGYLAKDIADKKELVAWLQKNPADIITMHLGTNDIVQKSLPTATITAAFDTPIGVMRAANPNMKIIVAQIIPFTIGNTAITSINAAIPAWAVKLNTATSPIWVVDQDTGFSTSNLRDGVHPNAAGDALMAAKWFPALENAIKLMNTTTAKTKIEFVA